MYLNKFSCDTFAMVACVPQRLALLHRLGERQCEAETQAVCREVSQRQDDWSSRDPKGRNRWKWLLSRHLRPD